MFQPEKATFRFSCNAMSFGFFVYLAYRVDFIRVRYTNRSGSVALRRVRATVVALEKQLHIISACL
jgi:hypothetical protein